MEATSSKSEKPKKQCSRIRAILIFARNIVLGVVFLILAAAAIEIYRHHDEWDAQRVQQKQVEAALKEDLSETHWHIKKYFDPSVDIHYERIEIVPNIVMGIENVKIRMAIECNPVTDRTKPLYFSLFASRRMFIPEKGSISLKINDDPKPVLLDFHTSTSGKELYLENEPQDLIQRVLLGHKLKASIYPMMNDMLFLSFTLDPTELAQDFAAQCVQKASASPANTGNH